jgi:hypothetical protein
MEKFIKQLEDLSGLSVTTVGNKEPTFSFHTPHGIIVVIGAYSADLFARGYGLGIKYGKKRGFEQGFENGIKYGGRKEFERGFERGKNYGAKRGKKINDK